MNEAILIFYPQLKENKLFFDYILRVLRKNNINLSNILFIEDNDNNTPFLIEEMTQKCDKILILSSEANHAFIAKILSTLSGKNVICKDDDLILQDCVYDENSFLINVENCDINVLKINPLSQIPKILLKNDNKFQFCMFDIDIDSINILLNPIASELQIEFTSIELLQNLVLISINNKNEKIDEFLKACKNLFNNKIIENNDIIKHCALKLISNNKKITFAESCTGGNLSANLSAFNGISEIFLGSFTAYSTKAKKAWLNVDEGNLKDALVYSQNCVSQMAYGALRATKSNYAIATSGVLGNSDDMGVKRGSVHICVVNDEGKMLYEQISLDGDRVFMQKCATIAAFMLLIKLDENMFLNN